MGVGGVQIGPGVFSLAVYLNKVGGLSYGKIAAVLSQMAGLELSRSTLCRAVQRTAKKSRPLYEELVRRIDSESGIGETLSLGAVQLQARSRDEVGYLGLHFNATWSDDHGVGVILHGQRIVTIETADIVYCFRGE